MKIASALVAVLVSAFVIGGSATALASPGGHDSVVKERKFRDPFAPFKPTIDEPTEPRSVLERIDLGALTLKAVILGRGAPRALVEDDAGLGYTLTIGTRVGLRRGAVVAIEPDRVVIEEESVDFYGEKRTTAVTLRLRTEDRATLR